MKNFIALTLFPFSVCIACDDVTAITETKMECYSRIVDTYWQCVDEGTEITECDVRLLDEYTANCSVIEGVEDGGID